MGKQTKFSPARSFVLFPIRCSVPQQPLSEKSPEAEEASEPNRRRLRPVAGAEAFPHLADDLLHRAAVVYVQVSFAKSRRKNCRRFNPERPDSILEHAMTGEVLTRLYRQDDWATFRAGDPYFLIVQSIRVPYVVLENEDGVTTGQPDLLAARLQAVLGQLWELRHNLQLPSLS